MPGCAIDFPATRVGHSPGNRRNELRDRLFCQLPDTVLWTASNTVRPAGGAYRRRIADPVAARERSKHSTMEGPGQRSRKDHPNMKAAIYTSYGPPEVVRIADVEKPVPKDDEVLIKVRAASVNPLDYHLLRHAFLRRVMSAVSKVKITGPGREVAEVIWKGVEAIGRNITQFKPGDEVFGECNGAFVEYACPRESALVRTPTTCRLSKRLLCL